MGLFKEIALLPLAPVRGTTWVAEQIAGEAERQLYDEDSIRREILQLEIDADEGRLGEKERAAKEDELLERLAVSRLRQAEAEQAAMLEARGDETEEEVPYG